MTTEQLQYFLTLATYLNFSAAAEHLFISQSTLSRNISAFEEELGAKLLVRSNNRVTLTPAGQLLKERAPTLLDQMKTLQVDVRATGDGITGQISIGIPYDQQINPWAYQAIAQFRARNPQVSIIFGMDEQQTLRSCLIEGKCDLLLTVQYFESDFPGMQTLVYAEDEPVLAVPYDHPCAALGELSLSALPEELQQMRCLLSRFSADYWKMHLPKNTPLQLWPMAGRDQALMLSVAAGESITLTNQSSALCSCPTVRSLRIAEPLPKLRLAAVYPTASESLLLEGFLACLANVGV